MQLSGPRHDHRRVVPLHGHWRTPRPITLSGCGCDGDQLAGFGSFLKKITKPVTKVLSKAAAPVLKLQKKIDTAVLKITPKRLQPLVSKVQASTQRATELTLVPTKAPEIIKAELKQAESVAKSKDVQKVAAAIAAGALIYFTGGAAAPAVMKLLQSAAERAALKKQQAQNEAEANAAQAEFDNYAKQLAAAQQQGQAIAAQQSPAAQAALLTQGMSQLAPGGLQPGFFAPGGEGSMQQPLPSWVVPAAVGAAALVLLPAVLRKSSAAPATSAGAARKVKRRSAR